MTGKERKAVRDAEEERLHAAVDNVLRTEAGRIVFKYLFKICGYNQSSIVVNPHTAEVNERSVIYNEARRGIYIQLRRQATHNLLAPMEEAVETEQSVPAIIKEGETK